MKKVALILPLLGAAVMDAPAANPALNTVVGRTIYHSDHSRTESVRDPNTRELTEITYDANDTMTVKKVFLLNEKGEPMQGNIYDGRGNLVARAVSIYDELGRRKEDKLMNLNGEVFQQVFHEYGANGKALKPKVVNLNVQAPTIRPAAIDFTKAPGSPAQPRAPGTPSTDRFAPVQMPSNAASDVSAPIYAPGAEPAGTGAAAAPEKPKGGNFFKRLFKKDK